ncbi:hypothetical protein BV20DRAFT_953305, partial [Pilatotrama ljubarskyi]
LQQFCQTQSNAEIEELLAGIKKRFGLLNIPDPDIVVADNCCHVRSPVKKVFPNTHVGLDVWHLLMRYNVCILGGSGNHARSEIADDIVSAILKTRADKYNPAVYWPQDEQERRLEAAYQKWAGRGMWNAAAAKTHQEQMKHVRKGCLTRPRSDVPSDGSRIEGSHKAWNGLQRSFASGLIMLTMLSHDHVLRRNHRADMDSGSLTIFVSFTHGSHHIRLVDKGAQVWNDLLAMSANYPTHAHLLAGVRPAPRFHNVNSGESFGIVQSQFAAGYQYMVDVKEEDIDPLVDLSSQPSQQAQELLASINIDPALLAQPLPSSAAAAVDGSTSTFPSVRHDMPLPTTSAAHARALPTTTAARAQAPSTTHTATSMKLPRSNITGLTPSQRVFSIATGINPMSVKVSSGNKFFLFMNLRAEHQWASYSMTPRKWVEAAAIYNTELEKLNRSMGHYGWMARKTPRALMEKLGEIEPMILHRLLTGDFKCELPCFLTTAVSHRC